MNDTLHLKWALEVCNQEYNGIIRQFNNACLKINGR